MTTVPDRAIFNERDYEALHRHVFRDGYAGYKPTVKEIPNGDGTIDADKRYAHVATKYFPTDDQAEAAFLRMYLEEAHAVALKVAEALRIPRPFWPDIEYGALRVLDYPPGAVSNKHEDFDLFTLMCFRDDPTCFKADETRDRQTMRVLYDARKLNEGLHFGQLGEEIGIAAATPHEVIASEKRQRSIVYFAIPDHKVFLPRGTTGDIHGAITVREWLNNRMQRSRTAFKAYE